MASEVKGLVPLAALEGAPFDAVVDAAFESLLTRDKDADREALLEDKRAAAADATAVKTAHGALVTALLTAAKSNDNEEAFGGSLEEGGLSAAQVTAIVSKYATHREKLRMLLRKTSTGLPHITDIDWKLQYYMESNQLDKVNEAHYTLQLTTEEGGGKKGQVQLACSLAQLQDLVSKLKDASKRLETLADA
eukprot:m.182144 g.182144  ORF g.182144 m.182144 type:complete len:192 (-) comp15454_c0_seq1:119-694(-)